MPDLRDLSDVELTDEIIAAAKEIAEVLPTNAYKTDEEILRKGWDRLLAALNEEIRKRWQRFESALNEHDRRRSDDA